MSCIFGKDFGLKPLYFVLHLTENGKYFNIAPPHPLIPDIILTVALIPNVQSKL